MCSNRPHFGPSAEKTATQQITSNSSLATRAHQMSLTHSVCLVTPRTLLHIFRRHVESLLRRCWYASKTYERHERQPSHQQRRRCIPRCWNVGYSFNEKPIQRTASQKVRGSLSSVIRTAVPFVGWVFRRGVRRR